MTDTTLTPDQIAAARAARVMGKHGELPPVSFGEQMEALELHLPYILNRLRSRAEAGKLHYATAAIDRKRLQQALATLRALAALELKS